MGLLSTFFAPVPVGEKRSIENPAVSLSEAAGWLSVALGGGPSTSGVIVSRESAMGFAPWWRAITLVSTSIAKLPYHVYRHKGARSKDIDTGHPAYPLLQYNANRLMTRAVWQRLAMVDVLTAGNHYSYVVRDGAARPLEILPLRPEMTWPVMEVMKGGERKLWYMSQISPDKGTFEMFRMDPVDVLHVKGLGFTGLLGMSVIAMAREALGLGMGAHEFATIYFRNAGSVSTILEVPTSMPERAIMNMRESWERLHTGLNNAHRAAVLRDGVKFHEVKLSAADSQLIESHKFSLLEIANFTGCPANKLGAQVNSSYGSLEQVSQDFVDDTLDFHFINIGEELQQKLLSEEEKRRGSHSIDVDRRKLKRANLADLTKHLVSMLQYGVYSPNDALHELGDNPREGGDIYYPPPNLSKINGDGSMEFTNDGAPPAKDGAEGAKDGKPAKPATGADGKPVQTGGGVKPGTGNASATAGELLSLPPIRQEKTYDCGPAAVRSVCKFLGAGLADDTEDAYIAALGTTPELGTPPHAIIDFLIRQKLAVAAASEMTVAGLEAAWKRGSPVLCCIQDWGTEKEKADMESGHWVVVVGIGMGFVFCMDPSEANAKAGGHPPAVDESDDAPSLAPIPAADFENRWWRDTDGKQDYIRFGIAVSKAEVLGGVGGGSKDADPNEGAEGAPDPKPKGPDPVAGPYGGPIRSERREESLVFNVTMPASPPMPAAVVPLPAPVVNVPEQPAPVVNVNLPTVTPPEPAVPVLLPANSLTLDREQARRLKDAHRAMLAADTRRLLRRVAHVAEKKWEKALRKDDIGRQGRSELCAWLDGFTAEHRAVFEESLRPSVLACVAVSRRLVTPLEVADGLLADLHADLSGLLEGEPRVTRVTEMAAAWEAAKPEAIARSLTGKRAKAVKVLCVDIGGTLAEQEANGDHGAPLPGCRQFLQVLADAGVRVLANSAHPPDEVEAWLKENGLSGLVEKVDEAKPKADRYLDDRMVRFKGTFDGLAEKILSFRPWWTDDYKVKAVAISLNVLKIGDGIRQGAVEFTEALRKEVERLVVVVDSGGIGEAENWLRHSGFDGSVNAVGEYKPKAHVYLDPAGMRFNGNYGEIFEKLGVE